MSPNQGDDDKVEAEKNPGEVTIPRDEFDPLNKRMISPLKPSS
jgi:hypothetical protein